MPSVLQDPIGWLLHGSGKSKSKGRRKGKKKGQISVAAHPIVAFRKAAAGIDEWRANGLEHSRTTRERSIKATMKTDKEKAAKKKREANAKARQDRMAAAQQRRGNSGQPTVRTVPAPGNSSSRSSRANSMTIGTIVTVGHDGQIQRFQRGNNGGWHVFGNPGRAVEASYIDGQMSEPNAQVGVDGRTPQRRATPEVSASLCNAPTEDGTPCRNPTTGGPCSAGHNPKSKPKTRRRPTVNENRETKSASGAGPRVNTASGNDRVGVQAGRVGGGERPRPPRPQGTGGGAVFNNASGVRVGQQAQTINGPTSIRMGGRTHDGLGNPLTPESAEFFRLRDVEGYKGPIRWDKGQMPFKCDENGERTG